MKNYSNEKKCWWKDLPHLKQILNVDQYKWDYAIIMDNYAIYAYSCCEHQLDTLNWEFTRSRSFKGVYDYEAKRFISKDQFIMNVTCFELASVAWHRNYVFN